MEGSLAVELRTAADCNPGAVGGPTEAGSKPGVGRRDCQGAERRAGRAGRAGREEASWAGASWAGASWAGASWAGALWAGASWAGPEERRGWREPSCLGPGPWRRGRRRDPTPQVSADWEGLQLGEGEGVGGGGVGGGHQGLLLSPSSASSSSPSLPWQQFVVY